jgi:hypothetical protein
MKKRFAFQISLALAIGLLLIGNASAQQLPTFGLAVIANNQAWIGNSAAVDLTITEGGARQVKISRVLIQYRPLKSTLPPVEMLFDLTTQKFLQGQVYYTTANCTGTPYSVGYFGALNDSVRAAQMVGQVAYVPNPWSPLVSLVVNSTLTSAGCGYVAPPPGAKFIPITRIVNFTTYPTPFRLMAY